MTRSRFRRTCKALAQRGVVIKATPPASCSLCSKVRELRPYGAGGALVCFECGMKDERTARKQAARALFGAS
jgi:hypothetical protein